MYREIKICDIQHQHACNEFNEKEGEAKMFNKKIKQENRMLRLDNNDLSNELLRVNDKLKAALAQKWGLEFQVKNLNEVISAQSELLLAFSDYIVNGASKKKVKKIKIKKGEKHGKKK